MNFNYKKIFYKSGKGIGLKIMNTLILFITKAKLCNLFIGTNVNVTYVGNLSIGEASE